MPMYSPPALTAPPLPAGQLIFLNADQVAVGGAAPAAVDILYMHLCRVNRAIQFASFGLRVVVGGAGSSIKCGIWANGPANKPLGAPLFKDDTGVTTQASTTTVTPAATGTLQPGYYWFGSKFTGTLPTFIACAANGPLLAQMIGISSSLNPSAVGYSIADAYSNALPTISDVQVFTAVITGIVPMGGLITA